MGNRGLLRHPVPRVQGGIWGGLDRPAGANLTVLSFRNRQGRKSMPDRRDLLAGAGLFFGASLAPPLAKALAAEASTLPGFTASHAVFNDGQRALVAAISDRIIPATDTPGAVAAGVPAFIEMMLADWYSAGDRTDFLAGLAVLDAFAARGHGKAFVALTPEQQDSVLTAAMHEMMPGLAAGFFNQCRQLVILGYYSSEIGCKQERSYLPVPGRYDGAYPVAKAGRIFSS
jgi:hypothetical protein